MFVGSFSVLSDKLNENLKKVFEADPSATEPKIYQGTVISYLLHSDNNWQFAILCMQIWAFSKYFEKHLEELATLIEKQNVHYNFYDFHTLLLRNIEAILINVSLIDTNRWGQFHAKNSIKRKKWNTFAFANSPKILFFEESRTEGK